MPEPGRSPDPGLSPVVTGVAAGAVLGCVVVVFDAGAAGSLVELTINPVGPDTPVAAGVPVTLPVVFGSTPSNEPFLRSSTAGIRGRSSRLTGFTI